MAALIPSRSSSAVDREQGTEESYETSEGGIKTFFLKCVLPIFSGLLLRATRSVLTDGRFRLPSPSSEAARKSAEILIEWIEDPGHRKVFDQFAVNLAIKFKSCFIKTQKTKHLKQAEMWGAYHKLRTSSSFSKDWGDFLEKSMKEKAPVAFYQYVSHEVFKELIKTGHPLNTTSTGADLPPLTYEEKTLSIMLLGLCAERCMIVSSSQALLEEKQ